MQRSILTPDFLARFSPALAVALAQAQSRTGTGCDLAFDSFAGRWRFCAVIDTEVLVGGGWSTDPKTAWRLFAEAVQLRIGASVVWN